MTMPIGQCRHCAFHVPMMNGVIAPHVNWSAHANRCPGEGQPPMPTAVTIDRDKLLAGLAQEQRKTFQYVRRVNARDGKPKHIRARAIEMPGWLLKHMSRSLRLGKDAAK